MSETPRPGRRNRFVPLRLARTSEQPFVHRLVAKFDLPVHGWRGQAERDKQALLARTRAVGSSLHKAGAGDAS